MIFSPQLAAFLPDNLLAVGFDGSFSCISDPFFFQRKVGEIES